MLFKEIIGHTKIKEKLIHSVKNDRISHAQLILGPEGNGKLALAIAYAQYISCENKQENDSCNTCKSCRKYNKLIHPDLHFVFPVIGSANVSDNFIHQWRSYVLQTNFHSFNNWLNFIGTENKQASIYSAESQQIIRKLNLKSFESKYKIMLIWMPEKMNISASNKLLKMLEEPPAKTIFLLISENEEQIITTIRSRTQLIKIPKLSSEDILNILKKQNTTLDEESLINIAKTSNGNFIEAENELNNINDSESESQNFELFSRFMRLAFAVKITEIVPLIDEISKLGREKQKNFLHYSLRLIRENFILNSAAEYKKEITYLTKKELEFSQKFNQFINNKNINQLYYEFNKAHQDIERNGYNKIIFLDLSLKTSRLLRK